MEPIGEQRILFNKPRIGTPISLSLDLVVDIGHNADMVGIPDKVSILSRTVDFKLVKALDVQRWPHVYSPRVHTIIRTAWKCNILRVVRVPLDERMNTYPEVLQP